MRVGGGGSGGSGGGRELWERLESLSRELRETQALLGAEITLRTSLQRDVERAESARLEAEAEVRRLIAAAAAAGAAGGGDARAPPVDPRGSPNERLQADVDKLMQNERARQVRGGEGGWRRW